MPSSRQNPTATLPPITAIFAVVSALLGTGKAFGAAGPFTLTALPTPVHPYSINPLAVGNGGRVVGSIAPSLDGSLSGPAIYENGAWRELTSFSTYSGYAFGVNNQGIAVGMRNAQFNIPPARAFLWDSQGEHDLGAGNTSQANAINEAGDVVGVRSPDGQTNEGFFLPHGGTPQSVIIPGAVGYTYLTQINNAGHILGWGIDENHESFASFFDGTSWTRLLGATVQWPGALNDHDEIVATLGTLPVIWRGGAWQTFGPPDGSFWPTDLNNSSHVIGWSAGHVWFWDGTQLSDLNTLVNAPGEVIVGVSSLSDDDHILAMATSDGNQSTHWVLLSPPFSIARPTAGSLYQPGQRDSIEWSGNVPGEDSLRAVLLDPRAGTTTTLGNAAVSDGKLVFTVPDALSRHCTVLLEALTGINVFAESPEFTVRGWDLARFDATLDDYVPFTRGIDDWSFDNSQDNCFPPSFFASFDYQGGIDPATGNAYPDDDYFAYAEPRFFPDWPSWVGAFGDAQCFERGLLHTSYLERAESRWQDAASVWGGSCSGFAITALQRFQHREQFLATYDDLPSVTNFFAYAAADLRPAINRVFASCNGQEHLAYQTLAREITPAQTVEQLKLALQTDTPTLGYLYLGNQRAGGGAHAVIPYHMERDTLRTNIYRIFVADPNDVQQAIGLQIPDSVVVDVTANSWVYRGSFFPAWGGTGRLYLMDAALNYFPPPPTLAPQGDAPAFASLERRPVLLATPAGRLDIGVSCDGATLITTDAGDSLGYVDSLVIEDIPGGDARVPPTGAPGPPRGYGVPSGLYALHCEGGTDSTRRVTTYSDVAIYTYRRAPAADASDRLAIGEGLGVLGEAVPHMVTLRATDDSGADERSWQAAGVTLAGDDSLHLVLDGRETARLTVRGAARECDLDLRFASSERLTRFHAARVPLPANSIVTIVPRWDDPNLTSAHLVVDRGFDGTLDDSLDVPNELVVTNASDDTHGAPDGAPSPAALRVLRGDGHGAARLGLTLAAASDVRVDVLDIRGRLVRTLANGRRTGGRSELAWDGHDVAGRTVPSGIYFARLEARPLDGGSVARPCVRIVRTR